MSSESDALTDNFEQLHRAGWSGIATLVGEQAVFSCWARDTEPLKADEIIELWRKISVGKVTVLRINIAGTGRAEDFRQQINYSGHGTSEIMNIIDFLIHPQDS